MNNLQTQYEKEVPDLEEFERFRKKKRLRLKINIFLFFGILATGIPVMIYYQDSNRTIFFAALIVMILNTLRHVYDYIIVTGGYSTYFKAHILQKLVPGLLPGIRFDLDTAHVEEEIRKSSLFWGASPTTLEVNGHFYGNTGDLNFEVYDFRQTVGYLDGVYMNITIDDPVGLVYVGPKPTSLGNMLKELPGAAKMAPNIPLQNLDLPEFGEVFAVYAESSEEALKVLTDHRIAAMLKLKKASPKLTSILFSFTENKLHLFISDLHFDISPSLSESLLDVRNVEIAFEDFNTQLTLLKALR